MQIRYYKLLLMFIIILFLGGCNRPIHIFDYYYIYPEDEFGEGYYLMCKLSSANDPMIENIKEVYWNKSTILLQTKGNHLYLIKARYKELACLNNDSLIGPILIKEKEKILNGKEKFNNKKKF